jgi:hypothetical protein
MEYANVRPDIIEVLAAGTFGQFIDASGRVDELTPQDARQQLRVIDVKLTAEATVGHFTEIVYYCMALAGWLGDRGLENHYVVVPDGALWPGSHQAAKLAQVWAAGRSSGSAPSDAQLRSALAEDLELLPFNVLVPRVKRFLQEELAETLSVPWHDQPWHVDNRCKGCEYLGQSKWTNSQGVSTALPEHCMPEAERTEHLSRVAFISRGASDALRQSNVPTVSALAALPRDAPAFGSHQTLRATRSVIAGRAASLGSQEASLPEGVGTSALMPNWADLRIYVSADFDIGSAITMAFGLQAFWREPRRYGAPATPDPETNRWNTSTFVVDVKDPLAERRELISFLDGIQAILDNVRARDGRRQRDPHYQASSVQFYIWDQLQFEHIARVIGRHLPFLLANDFLRHLAWLFPPEELLQNPSVAATRKSYVTIVREVVRPLLAAPVPHYYSLLEVARAYHGDHVQDAWAEFRVHPHFEDPLSDQIPSERAHEIWSKSGQPRPWAQQVVNLQRTVDTKLRALSEVSSRLERDLRPRLLQRAPGADISPPQPIPRASVDGQLWYGFAKLDAALVQQEVWRARAMPPDEREARFRSVRLERRLTGADEATELQWLGQATRAGRRVYLLRPESREAKLREGDFTFALAPEAIDGFLDAFPGTVLGATAFPGLQPWHRHMEDLTSVKVVALDREQRTLVVDESLRGALNAVEAAGIDLSENVILDPTEHDFFTKKLKAVLQEIGNPPRAAARSEVLRATGLPAGRRVRQAAETPASEVLWDAQAMSLTSVARQLPPVRQVLEDHGMTLNSSQWDAWAGALQRRVQLIWGPPGTGKSRTLQAVVVGAMVDAHRAGRPLRILLCGPTYKAIDNVLQPALDALDRILPAEAFNAHRVRSYLQPETQDPTLAAVDLVLNNRNPDQAVDELRSRLDQNTGITLVTAPPEQLYNLITAHDDPPLREWFDLIVVDEASQLDVAKAILVVAGLDRAGALVVAGDSKQLPPIHAAVPPAGLESMVGSFYTFLEDVHHLTPKMLMVNYRSNRTIVEYSRSAGYDPALASFSPLLELDLLSPVPTDRPADWPAELGWSPEFAAMIDPSSPATCFVYPDGRSSQWNQFEADTVASLIWLLRGRLSDQLQNEQDPESASGVTIPRSTSAYSEEAFWRRAVGVVTPHKAQQGLIISRLAGLFVPQGTAAADVRSAVDTVERFQGQQRDVILATFALGDPDAIREEQEFLMSLNRFNVMASRARAKLIVLVSRELVDHLADDIEILRGSSLLKLYAETFCANRRDVALEWLDGTAARAVSGSLRKR